jgi:hypothetical protein
MSNLVSHFISGAQFCRPCALGLVTESSLTNDQAQTLGLIISECFGSLNDPVFAELGFKLGIDDRNIPSIADIGSLVHAEASKKHGLRIIYVLPEWLNKFKNGIRLGFCVRLASALSEFVRSYAKEHPWLLKFSINESVFLKSTEDKLGAPLKYTSNWMSINGIEKLRQLKIESNYIDESIKHSFNDSLNLISGILKTFEYFDYSDDINIQRNNSELVSLVDTKKSIKLNIVQSQPTTKKCGGNCADCKKQ